MRENGDSLNCVIFSPERISQTAGTDRLVLESSRPGLVPSWDARYPDKYDYNDATKTLHVGAGAFAPVMPEVYNFEVSGLKVVQSWLGYRMKNPKGKKRSSPLDDIRPDKWSGDFTTELLELLWILEATIAEYPGQAKLLAAVATRRTLRV